jgi:uncharacterized coiled-coil protein SlyX
VVATLEDLEARVAALEASQADYGAVLAAVNALGANQREHSFRLTRVETRLDGVETRLSAVEIQVSDLRMEMRAGFRTADEHFAELRDLIVRRNNDT